MRVGGILETALYVSDLNRAADFYRRLFDFGTLLENDRLIALDVVGRNVLLLFLQNSTLDPFIVPGGGGTIPPHGASGQGHFAFSITADDVPAWKRHLESHGVPIESVVTWPTGAVSLYFRDPDHNLAELITPGFWSIY